MTTRSCNFFRSQSLQLRMGYDYEIRQQVHLLKKNSIGTSCAGNVITSWLCEFDKLQQFEP